MSLLQKKKKASERSTAPSLALNREWGMQSRSTAPTLAFNKEWEGVRRSTTPLSVTLWGLIESGHPCAGRPLGQLAVGFWLCSELNPLLSTTSHSSSINREMCSLL